MNQRIRQLWDESAKLESDSSWEGQTRFMQKFAELIVKECMYVVEDAGGIDKYHYTRAISQHFGVEE